MSSLIPHLAESAPFIARLVPWLFVFDALLIVGVVIGGASLVRFRARLTAAEIRRVAGTTSYRQIHSGLVLGRRRLVSGMLIIASGVAFVWVAGYLPRDLLEFFVAIFFGGLCLPLYCAIHIFEELFRLTADRVDELLKQSVTNS